MLIVKIYFSYLQYYENTYIQCLEMHSNTRGLRLTSEELNNTDLTVTRKKDDCPIGLVVCRNGVAANKVVGTLSVLSRTFKSRKAQVRNNLFHD